MKPELVLTEDDKKRRFKKFLRKKETECAVSPVSGYDQDPVTAGSLWTSDSADSVFSATSEPPKPALQLPPINLKVSSHWSTLTILTSDWSRTTRASPRPS